jgi:hypothetical protein
LVVRNERVSLFATSPPYNRALRLSGLVLESAFLTEDARQC